MGLSPSRCRTNPSGGIEYAAGAVKDQLVFILQPGVGFRHSYLALNLRIPPHLIHPRPASHPSSIDEKGALWREEPGRRCEGRECRDRVDPSVETGKIATKSFGARQSNHHPRASGVERYGIAPVFRPSHTVSFPVTCLRFRHVFRYRSHLHIVKDDGVYSVWKM